MQNKKMKLLMPVTFPIACHTDQVGPDSTFVVINGYKQNGVSYISLALAKGATAIVVSHDTVIPDDVQKLIDEQGAKVTRVDNTRRALAELSAQAAGYPADRLRFIGITGTKGKTSSSFLLYHLLRSASINAALISTVKNMIGDQEIPAQLTTEQPDYLHQFFKMCVEQGVEYVVMEVAAQATSLYRSHGLRFDYALFTNLSQEHGEFYSSMDDYFAAKCQLFEQLKPDGLLFINGDDARSAEIKAHYPHAQTFGFGSTDIKAHALESRHALEARFIWPDTSLDVSCPSLIGRYNIYNMLGVCALARAIGISDAKIVHALQTFGGVRGRMERHDMPNGATCIIDYAHNPSSYEQVLSTVRPLTDQLIVVFGCGGERDPARRPIMGSIAALYADVVILTSDNPRSENADKIIQDILAGIEEQKRKKVIQIIDRQEAIAHAYHISRAGSLFLLLGKGPDEYQIIGAAKSYFSEVEILNTLSAKEKPTHV